MTFEERILSPLRAAREAARALALAGGVEKNAALLRLAGMIRDSRAVLVEKNRADLARARAAGRSGAFVERLTLGEDRIEAMAQGVEEVAALPDPVGEVMEKWTRPNGLVISKTRVPIGVIAIIYESRPNVTIDAGVLCLKAGSAVVLRGGKEALSTNAALADLISRALEDSGLRAEALSFIANPDHEAIQVLKHHPELIDLIIPRGGGALKRALSGSEVALLPHFDGICHTYVDRAANLKMALEICVNAKCSRPSVCNAMENLLVHSAVAPEFIPAMAEKMRARGVELRGCARARQIVGDISPASAEDWDTEYLDLVLAVKVVDTIEEAIEFITRHGSHLADAIVTEDSDAAGRFEREVDSATVYVNASTRFTDGFEFGFGAETGISTNRLHARGPMGLRELTTYKFVIEGSGQLRA